MTPDTIIADIKAFLSNAEAKKPDSAADAQSNDHIANLAAYHTHLKDLIKLYEKQTRHLNRLTKLSDATQEKLTVANDTMSKLTRNLSRFVPDTVVKELASEGAEQLPDYKREKLTVFFSDIVGFTSLTAQLEPELLASVMTDYFTQVSAICTKWGGTLGQFIGDAVVIFFGAPRSHGHEEDAKAAIGMALEMQQALIAFRASWAAKGMHQQFDVRMGLATDYCTIGNFGSVDRLHYTAIGSAVNSAARIQSAAPSNEILLAEDTYLLVRDHFHCTTYKTMTLQGQKHASTLFQLTGNQGDWQSQILTSRSDGYRFYLDPQAVSDKSEVITLLETALERLTSGQETKS